MTAEVAPGLARPTHHLELVAENGEKLGLILCDASGKARRGAINRSNLESLSLKISEGNPKHSDFDFPFTPILQEDWSGGRGQEAYERDVTKFLDSYRLDTTRSGKAFLAGRSRFGFGAHRVGHSLKQPGSVKWQALVPGSRRFLAIAISHPVYYPMVDAYLPIKRHGAPADLTVELAYGTSTQPLDVLTTATLDDAVVADVIGELRAFSMRIAAAGTNYVKNPVFEVNVTDDWSFSQAGAGAAVSLATVEKQYGSASARIGAGTAAARIRATTGVSVPNNSVISAFAWVRPGGNPVTAKAFLGLWDGTSALLRAQTNATRNGQWELLRVSWTNTTGSAKAVTVQLENAFNDSATNVWFDGATLELASTSPAAIAGSFGTGYAWTGTAHNSTSTRAAASGYPLTGGYVWLKVYGAATATDEDHWRVGLLNAPGSTYESEAGSTWVASSVDLYYRAKDADLSMTGGFLFEYRRSSYYCTAPGDGTASKLYLNGDRGAADSNSGSLGFLIDATKAWTTDEWKDAVVLLIEGPGSLELRPWRKIVTNTGSQLQVDAAWKIAHTTSTSYVILGSDEWRLISGTQFAGAADVVADVAMANNIVYFALGEATNLRRHREYNNAGTWTETDFADDGTNKANRLALVMESTPGMYRALNDTVDVSKAPLVTWPTNLTFGTAIPIGDDEYKIQKIGQYIDPNSTTQPKTLWVVKTDGVWLVRSGAADQIPLDEMRAVASFENGRAMLVHNVYLYFSFLRGLERFYNNQLDDIGPTVGRGLPADRQGSISAMTGYPGKFFAAVDAGATGYSTIQANTGGPTWHEFYRCPEAGQSILALRIQVVPGAVDRLWFQQGQDLLWLPLPSETTDPTQDPAYPYHWEGYVTSSRMHSGMQDIVKLWDSIKVVADNLEEDNVWIEIDYLVNDESNPWTTIDEPFELSPSLEQAFSSLVSVKGNFLMVRVRLLTSDELKSPELRATVTSGVARIPQRHGMAPTVRLKDNDINLRNEPDDIASAVEKVLLLDKWSETIEVLQVNSATPIFHGLRVFIESPILNPYFESDTRDEVGFIATLAMTQVKTTAQVELEEELVAQ